MNSQEYWTDRLGELAKEQEENANNFVNSIQEQYDKVLESIKKDIEVFYYRYANAEEITYAATKKLLTDVEKENWKVSLEQYREMALSGEFQKELDAMYARSRISRFEALNTQIKANIDLLNQNILEGTTDLLDDTFKDTYYRTIYEIQKGTGIGINFATYNQDAVDNILSKPWKYGNFSSHLWKDKAKLFDELETNLTHAFIRGDSVDKTIKIFSKRMDVDKFRSARIIQTESAYISGEATARAYNSQGIDEYEYLATLDTHTSKTCQQMDGKIFKLSDKKTGINYPPLHAFCRSTTIPYFKDEENSKRIARAANGKSYYVEGDMKYKDWKKSIIDGGAENQTNKFKKIYEAWDGQNIKAFATNIVNEENLPMNVQRHKLSGAHGQCKLRYNDSIMEVITYELDSKDIRDVEYQVKTAFHELFHAKSNGLICDIGEIPFKDWAYVDDVFAESTAHYIVKSIGIEKEIAPSYASHLIEALPKLKTLPEFKSCETIADFGEVAYKYRFSSDMNAKWKPILKVLKESEHDIIEYSKNYISYIEESKFELVDKLLENMPQYLDYKDNMINDIDGAIKSINNGNNLRGNEEFVFNNALIISMNRVGVK